MAPRKQNILYSRYTSLPKKIWPLLNILLYNEYQQNYTVLYLIAKLI